MNNFKKIIEPRYVYISTITTLLTGVATTVLNAFDIDSAFFYISLGMFLVGISTVLMQVLIATCIINESIENTAKAKSGVLLPSQAIGVQNRLEELINTPNIKIKKIKIICYGTSGYGEVIKNIHRSVYPGANGIKLEVMVCSPNNVYMNSRDDKNKIEALVSELQNARNISIYYAKFLPTIRGCVVYGRNNKPIWTCLQTYSYGSYPTSSADYGDFYALVGDKENEYLLKNSEKIISKEFDRLKT